MMERDFTFRCYDNTTFTGFLDNYESITWNTNLKDAGDCEIVMALNNVDFNVIDVGFIVMNPNRAKMVQYSGIGGAGRISDVWRSIDVVEACFITSKTISQENGTVTFKGKTLDWEWDQRIWALPVQVYADQFINTIFDTVASICVFEEHEPLRSRRMVHAMMSLPNGNFYPIGEELSVAYKSGRVLLQNAIDMWEKAHDGDIEGVSGLYIPTITVDETDHIFELNPDCICIDRTARKTINGYEIIPVVFSTSFDNVFNVELTKDVEDFKNVAFVAGEGEGTARVTVWAPEQDPGFALMDRRELFVDARDLRSADYATSTQYQNALKQRGIEKLVGQVDTYAFEVPQDSTSHFRDDFYLGDMLSVRLPEFDVTLGVRVTSATETYSKEGYTCDLTFGTMKQTLSQRLNQKFGN